MSLAAPVAYHIILEPGIGEFECPRVRTRTNISWDVSCALIDLWKARERELATLYIKTDDQWVLNPMHQQIWRQQPEVEERDDTSDHGLYVQKLESRIVQKKTKTHEKRWSISNQQQGARQVSTEQHKPIFQLRTNTTACTWPANCHSNGAREHSNNKAHRLYFS